MITSLLRKSVDRRKSLGKKKNGGGFKADFSKLLVCDNGTDNSPDTYQRGTAPYETVYFVSQSRSPGHKDIGQDAMSVATHGDWECNVLCDGHDRDGHLVSRAVCARLPHVILGKVFEREKPGKPVEASLLEDAFGETSAEVCWTSEGVRAGMFVKVFGGVWDGKVGYVGDARDTGSVVIIVDDDGYHRPLIAKEMLKRAKFTGGCTCVVLLHNVRTGDARVAITGDSRALMLYSQNFDDPIMKPIFGIMDFQTKAVPPMAMTSPAHNVFNTSELLRLNTHHQGAFEIEGAFLVNPVTKFSIQPTRGFGDFDMFGTGYIDVPEVSSNFKLMPGSLVFVASDGVFDEHVWHDDELVSFLAEHAKPNTPTFEVADLLFNETLQRSLAGNYVDDISFFLFACPPIDESADAEDEATLAADSASETASNRGSQASAKGGAGKPKARKSRLASLLGSAGGRALGSLSSAPGGKSSEPMLTKSAMTQSSKSLVDDDDERLLTKPDVDAASAEDRRKTIERKDRGQFTQLSNFLLDALAKRKPGDGDADDMNEDEAKEQKELADVVLHRLASQKGFDPALIGNVSDDDDDDDDDA